MWGADTSGIDAQTGDSGGPVYVPSGGIAVAAVGIINQANGNFAHVMSALNWWNLSIIK
jgi:hypothetical protein